MSEALSVQIGEMRQQFGRYIASGVRFEPDGVRAFYDIFSGWIRQAEALESPAAPEDVDQLVGAMRLQTASLEILAKNLEDQAAALSARRPHLKVV